jgi:hypothetical protein
MQKTRQPRFRLRALPRKRLIEYVASRRRRLATSPLGSAPKLYCCRNRSARRSGDRWLCRIRTARLGQATAPRRAGVASALQPWTLFILLFRTDKAVPDSQRGSSVGLPDRIPRLRAGSEGDHHRSVETGLLRSAAAKKWSSGEASHCPKERAGGLRK